MARARAVHRTQRCRQMPSIRIFKRTKLALYRDNPMTPQVQRQLLVETLDESRTVLIQEGDEADGAFLRVPVGEGERARVHELAAQRLVAPLRRLNHLAVKRLQVAPHPLERGARRPFERGIERL